MKLEIKAVKYMPTLSEETIAFSANVYIGGKCAGHAKNSGQGAETYLRIEPAYQDHVDAYAKCWLDYLQPHPFNFKEKATLVDGVPHYPRISASERVSHSPYADLSR